MVELHCKQVQSSLESEDHAQYVQIDMVIFVQGFVEHIRVTCIISEEC